MAYHPIFGEPLAVAEEKYHTNSRNDQPIRDPDKLFAIAKKLGGDTLSHPMLATRIALEENISIEEAVIRAHMLIWPW